VSRTTIARIERCDRATSPSTTSRVGGILHRKGGRQRRILIADPKLVVLLRKHLRGIKHGPVFRAEFHDTGRSLTYASAHASWVSYCKSAGVIGTIHQLRHSHGSELVNAGVPLAVIRKRLGHRRMDTTLYAEVSDPVSDEAPGPDEVIRSRPPTITSFDWRKTTSPSALLESTSQRSTGSAKHGS
jgi:integrase